MFPIKDTIPSRTFPIVTISIIMINCLVFWYELALGPQLNQFIQMFCNIFYSLVIAPHRSEERSYQNTAAAEAASFRYYV